MHAVYEPALWITQETSRANPDFHHGLLGLSSAPVIQAQDGNFYGTTNSVGVCCSFSDTVFKLTTGGKVTVVYKFDGTHGSVPYGGLVQGSDGNFYGSASSGGKYNGGVVFKLTAGASITVLSNYNPTGSDGFAPVAGLVLATDGKFYGTTQFGGQAGGAGGGVLFC